MTDAVEDEVHEGDEHVRVGDDYLGRQRVGDIARRAEELGIGGIGERVRVELGIGSPLAYGDEQTAVDREEVRRRAHDADQLRGVEVRPRDVEDADARRARDVEEVAVADHVRRASDRGLPQQAQRAGDRLLALDGERIGDRARAGCEDVRPNREARADGRADEQRPRGPSRRGSAGRRCR